MIFLYTLLFIFCLNLVSAKVTDKQYASMPGLFNMDNYDQCMLLGDEALSCYFTYQLEPLDPGNSSETWKIIQEVNSDEYNYRHDQIRNWICIPLSCPIENKDNKYNGTLESRIEECFDKKYRVYGLKGKVENLKCEGISPAYPVDYIDVLAAIVFISYVIFVIYATCTCEDRITTTRSKDLSKWRRILTSFSITRNWQRLKSIKETPDIVRFKSYQGVRFYNTILVVLSHTTISMVFGPVANVRFIETMSDKVGNLFISSGSVCVSTFFHISAFFLMIGMMEKFKDKEIKFKHLLLIFINRYLRLTPSLAIIVLYYATWMRHMGNGPNWNNIMGPEYHRCRENGWTNLVFLNNWIGKERMCMVHTWYLALDTQYFAILLLVIWFVHRYPKLTYPSLVTLSLTTILGTFFENYAGQYDALLIPRPESLYEMKNFLPNPQWHVQTSGFLGNCAGSITGLYFGYWFLQNKDKKEACGLFKYHLISYGLGLSATLIPGIFIFILDFPKNPFWASVTVALGRPIFSFAIGYGIYKTLFGVGWITNHVLRWQPVYILARLSYNAYLVHVCIILSRAAAQRYPVYVTDTYMVYHLIGDLTCTYMVALLLTLLIELPISDLQKLIIQSTNDDVKKE